MIRKVEDSYQRGWQITWKRSARIAIDAATLLGAVWVAYLLRYEWAVPEAARQQATIVVPLLAAAQYLVLWTLRVERSSWTHVSLHEVKRILIGVVLPAVVFLALRYGLAPLVAEGQVPRWLLVPSGVVIIDVLLALVGLTMVRSLRRVQREHDTVVRRRNGGSSNRENALIVGAGSSGQALAAELRRRPDLGIVPVGFLDDDENLRGRFIHGTPVLGGIASLAHAATTKECKVALIALDAASHLRTREIVQQCEEGRVKAKIVPPVSDVVSGRLSVSAFRDVQIEDLLGRDPVEFSDLSELQKLAGRTVLVTGAGGSIGSELCRQLMLARVGRLVMVERTENSLFEVHRELGGKYGTDRLVPAVGDITDATRMRAILESERPEIVFHAAAHKHVPMMEANPLEAIKNNFLGTCSLADAVSVCGVPTFVMISTDKAVNPTSVMGVTKRLAELYLQEIQSNSDTRFVAVRFGNVLGSAGSVIPIFKDQIRQGGPVTITHPDMVRYFMTIPEAARLVIQAGELGPRGSIMVLEMGEPVRILDLARQMIRLSGLEPDADIRIEYSGMRPGEKLFEELGHDLEKHGGAISDRIYVWSNRSDSATSIAGVREQFRRSTMHPEEPEPQRVRALLANALGEYTPTVLEPVPRRTAQFQRANGA